MGLKFINFDKEFSVTGAFHIRFNRPPIDRPSRSNERLYHRPFIIVTINISYRDRITSFAILSKGKSDA